MPTYNYRCSLCGAVAEHIVTIAQRLDPQECLECEGRADFEFCPPAEATAVVTREKGVIMSEKQLPEGWRDHGTTGLEGGAGKKLYF